MSFTQTPPTAGRITITCTLCGHAEGFVKGDDIAIARFKRGHKCPTTRGAA